ncbi:photosynthetic protein synthase I [Roseovarius atlanticus]|uniref:Photosynthetic protein synthase I n=1 Tax=Roseovarius atlanticus TaxID=1641875 RepID=A0A0T5NSV4_9RHOB|nr:SCO family protein [Roseovarius atlanticus]KRS11988.1 photosynthetic protein synthase I [Roseovarius atlanticus]
MRAVPAIAVTLLAGMALAHDGEDHGQGATTLPDDRLAAALKDAPTALPWQVGGPFELTDHTGRTRTQADPEGRHQLLFFGYANCPGICSAALPLMADAVAELEAGGVEMAALVVTIDPKLDTVETMGASLAKVSDDLLGLTGTPEALDVAYQAFQVEFEHLFDDPEHGPIYSHGSFIYLLDPEGEVLTQVPPVLPPEQVSAIVRKYVGG